MNDCIRCGAALTADDVGATRKFIHRAATEFYCLDCIADLFKIKRAVIEERIASLRALGCTLFPKEDKLGR